MGVGDQGKVLQALRAASELRRRNSAKLAMAQDFGEHPKQDAFVLDDSPIVLASCGRRAGKSTGTGRKILRAMERHPRCIIPYIVMSREGAKDIIWPSLQGFDDKYGIGLKFRENNGDVVHPNGSKLILRGAGSRREIDKLRGSGGGHPLIVIDEAQVFGPSLQYMFEEALEPATMDYGSEAQICLIGSPNAANAGPFRDMIKRGVGPHYHWTALDNPYLPNPKEFLEQKARSRGGAHVASFRREYLGEWIRDESSLVFRLKPAVNVIDYYDFGQATDWIHVLGVDLGFNDPSAFVVIAYSQDLNTAVVMESFEKTELTASKVAAIVEDLDQSYGFANMRGDSQGYGKSIVEGLKEDYGIPMQAAKKRDKPARIEMINSDLRNGVIKILRRQNIDLIEQMGLLQWDEEALESNKYQFADTRFADHLADAFVYAYWDCHPNTDNWVKDPPRRDSPQWFKELEEKWIQAKEEEVFRKPDEMDWFG